MYLVMLYRMSFYLLKKKKKTLNVDYNSYEWDVRITRTSLIATPK